MLTLQQDTTSLKNSKHILEPKLIGLKEYLNGITIQLHLEYEYTTPTKTISSPKKINKTYVGKLLAIGVDAAVYCLQATL